MSGKVAKKRNIIVFAVIGVLFLTFLVHIFNIQVVGTNKGKDTAVSVVTVSVPAIRGEILDRYGYPLVTNKQVNKIIFNYLAFPKDYTERNKIIIELVRMFDKNKVEWNDELPIKITKKGELLPPLLKNFQKIFIIFKKYSYSQPLHQAKF
ncbi:MAG: hypothetical protein IIX36_07015 [Clostridia bacterium]|nr:hypothetical protein [Clostridia bacterium]